MTTQFMSRVGWAAFVGPAAGLCLFAGCSSGEPRGDAASATPHHASATPHHLVEGPTTPLAPGTYRFSVFANPGVQTPDALVEVPGGFDDEAAWYVVSHDRHEFLGLWTAGQVDRDPCLHGEEDAFDPGPSVEDMADALVAQKATRASAPEPVTLAGHRGLYVELASPRDISRCDPEPGLWNDPGGRGIYGDGQVDRVWILDVDGQRLVVDASYSAKSTASDRADLTSMVESLEFLSPSRE